MEEILKNEEKLQKIVDYIKKKILTPVIFLEEYPEMLEFICFLDRNIKIHEVAEIENKIAILFSIQASITDIREYPVSERLDIINKSKLVYSESPLVEELFILSMAEDYKKSTSMKRDIMERYRNSGTCYLQ